MTPTDSAGTVPTLGLYELLCEVADADTVGAPRPERALEQVVTDRLRAYASKLQGHTPRDLYALIMPQLERPLIRVAMELAGGQQIGAARMLGIHRNTLRVRLRSLGLTKERSS